MLCPLHGAGTDPTRLVGRTLSRVVASWHISDGERSEAPLDVWLIDSVGDSIRITTGSDQCLIVESAAPHEPYDMGEWGRIEVGEDLGDGVEPPAYPAGEGHTKTSAAWLIDKAGFTKGYGTGPARISTKHTLALTNRGGATTEDLLALAREVVAGVEHAFGVTLVNEPVTVNAEI